jgi:hypothetical protein
MEFAIMDIEFERLIPLVRINYEVPKAETRIFKLSEDYLINGFMKTLFLNRFCSPDAAATGYVSAAMVGCLLSCISREDSRPYDISIETEYLSI